MNPSKVDELKKKVEEVIQILKVLYEERNHLLLENRRMTDQLEEVRRELNRHQNENEELERLTELCSRLKQDREVAARKLSGILKKIKKLEG